MKYITIVISAEKRDDIDAALDHARLNVHDGAKTSHVVSGYPYSLDMITHGLDDVDKERREASAGRIAEDRGSR